MAARAPVSLSFLGAAETVTGSRFLVETPRARVLVDCGLFQGERHLRRRNWQAPPVDPASVDAVLVTHAHLDHCGYLPVMARLGFRGPVWATEDTVRLMRISLPDAAHIQETEARLGKEGGYSRHAQPLPLFDKADAATALALTRPVRFDHSVDVAPGMSATFRRAGHILGSAFIELDVDGRRILFSGDLGRDEHPLLRGPEAPHAVDAMVVESTYGDEMHPPVGDDVLADVITRTAARRGSCLLPAFAIDRTPLVVMLLKRLEREKRIPRGIPIYVDSPMALRAWEVYRDALERGDEQLKPGLDPRGLEWVAGIYPASDPFESARLNNPAAPSIIVSASGMATGGRVLHHLRAQLPNPRNAVILTGFQVPGTRGHQLLTGARQVKIHGEYVPVRAEVVSIPGMSAHADSRQVMDWIAKAGEPDVVYVVHGERQASDALAAAIGDDLGWNAVVPRPGERVVVTTQRRR